ncbi:hypothetical protein [Sporomusa aerivorans]|uniref:hypothetical protein n=1 Tax=Sporomusa aerivorans TaxID=204936 RepID=UPI00352AD8C0
MSLHCDNLDDTPFRFPRTGFWIIHILGGLFLVLLGMRLAMRRMSLPFIAYRLFKILR